jgi:Tetracyclin repressor-like, C-terminal domain
LRSAVTNEHAAAKMREIFATQVAPALAAAVGPDLARRQAGIIASQMLGLGLTRYLLRLPAVTALTPSEIEDALGPAITATLEAKPEAGRQP